MTQMGTRSLEKLTQDDPEVHTGSYDSQIECLKDIISGLKAEIERHDRECNLTRQQEKERLREKDDKLWKVTKDLDEVRQCLSAVKTDIDSMHRMMTASEEAANVEKKNPHSSNNSGIAIGDEQNEMSKLRESVSLLEARMEGVLDEAAELHTENKRLKDELGKGRSENLTLEAKLRDEDHLLNTQLSDLILKVNENSEILNLFSDHFKSDASQVKALRGRLEAFCAELQEIETRVDICADELQLGSVHFLPHFQKHSISHKGSEGRVAEKVRCLIEQGLLKVAGRRSHQAMEKPLEPNKAGLEVGNYTEGGPTPSFGHVGAQRSDTDERHFQAQSSDCHPIDSAVDTIVVATGKTYCQPPRPSVPDTSATVPGKMIDCASSLGVSEARKTKLVDHISLPLETFRLTVLLRPLSAILSTENEASLTLKSLLKIETIYSLGIVKDNVHLDLIDKAIETGRCTNDSLSKALASMRLEGEQVFGDTCLKRYVDIFKLFIRMKRLMNDEKGGAAKIPKATEQIHPERDLATAGAYRSRRVKSK